MSNQLVPFEQQQLPAYLQMGAADADDLIAGTGGGFPVVSIKGKVFHIRRGDEREMVTRPDGSGEPASAIEVVIIRANPNFAKNYYKSNYEEGSDEKPTCYSNDGITPAFDAVEPQSVKCAGCPHNQWGSRTSESGSKAKSCADSRKIAIAPVGGIGDPMLLRVPAASLKPLGEYGKLLKARGVTYAAVSTRISFDFAVSHPSLTFKPVGFLPEEAVRKVAEMRDSEAVLNILGMGGAALTAAPALTAPATTQPAPVKEQDRPVIMQAAEKPAPVAKKAAPKKPSMGAALGAATQEELPLDPAPTMTVKPTPKVTVVTDDAFEAEMANVLGKAGFDDQ